MEFFRLYFTDLRLDFFALSDEAMARTICAARAALERTKPGSLNHELAQRILESVIIKCVDRPNVVLRDAIRALRWSERRYPELYLKALISIASSDSPDAECAVEELERRSWTDWKYAKAFFQVTGLISVDLATNLRDSNRRFGAFVHLMKDETTQAEAAVRVLELGYLEEELEAFAMVLLARREIRQLSSSAWTGLKGFWDFHNSHEPISATTIERQEAFGSLIKLQFEIPDWVVVAGLEAGFRGSPHLRSLAERAKEEPLERKVRLAQSNLTLTRLIQTSAKRGKAWDEDLARALRS